MLGTELVGTVRDVDVPSNVRRAMHVCKGNGTQSWIAEGGYGEFSKHVFKRADGFDVFHLDYDDERSVAFEPLANLPGDRSRRSGWCPRNGSSSRIAMC